MIKEQRIEVPKGMGDFIETPKWLFDYLNQIFSFEWDAAANSDNCLVGNWAEDCLNIENWKKYKIVYMNPPYSCPGKFLQFPVQAKEFGVTTVALVKRDSSTIWWNKYVKPHATVIDLPFRIRFQYKGLPTKDVANFPSALAIYFGTTWRP